MVSFYVYRQTQISGYYQLEQNWNAHRLALKQKLFIASKSNLKSEITTCSQFLTELQYMKPFLSDNLPVDSLYSEISLGLEQTKGWVTDLGKYDLKKQILSSHFGDSNQWLREVPAFYKQAKIVLRDDAFTAVDAHIKKQIENYWYLKKEIGLSQQETLDARLAVKDFIAFLESKKREH